MNEQQLDQLRHQALERLDAAESRTRWLFILLAVVEGLLLVAFFATMDTSDRLHWLLLISSTLVYATIGVGLVTLASFIQSNTLKVLQSVEALHEDEE